jgi:hypothetical protein
MYNPMMSTYLAAEKRRDLLHEVELDRYARAATPYLTGLVARVLDLVRTRLGLRAHGLGSRATRGLEPSHFSKQVPGSSCKGAVTTPLKEAYYA